MLISGKHTATPNNIKVPVTTYSTDNKFCALVSASDHSPHNTISTANAVHNNHHSTTPQPSRRALRRRHAKHVLHLLAQQEDAFLDKAIARGEHERTAIAKADHSLPQRLAIEANHRLA
jgi:hypothetical protein